MTMLYSRKSVIPRDLRYLGDTEYPTVVLGKDPPYIHVVPMYNSLRMKYLTPIANVKLV